MQTTKKRLLLGFTLLAALAASGYIAMRVNTQSQPASQLPPPQAVEPPSADTSLGGEVYENSTNPLNDSLPEFNPFNYQQQ